MSYAVELGCARAAYVPQESGISKGCVPLGDGEDRQRLGIHANVPTLAYF